jgi:purine-binding chemotaxis protein CheW
MSTTPTAGPTQFLSFILGGEEYAIEILRVKEIIEYDEPTRVPAMPPMVRGVVNLRGRVVPVLDLAERFGLPATSITPRSCIVMVEVAAEEGATVVGLITDAVCEVLDLTLDRVQPPPSLGTSVGAEYLDGLAETANRRFTMLLNVDRALAAVMSPTATEVPALAAG